jgi:hypothetical protein
LDETKGQSTGEFVCGSPMSLNFIFCSVFLLSDLNQQMRASTLNAKNICSIHCWQHMKISEVFEFDKDTVMFGSFLQWMKAKFSRVISFSHGFSVKVYYLSDIESWDHRITIDDNETLRSNLMLVSNEVSAVLHHGFHRTREPPKAAVR